MNPDSTLEAGWQESCAGREFMLCIGDQPFMHGVVESYTNGVFTVLSKLTDTSTGIVRDAIFTIDQNDPNVIYTMEVLDTPTSNRDFINEKKEILDG